DELARVLRYGGAGLVGVFLPLNGAERAAKSRGEWTCTSRKPVGVSECWYPSEAACSLLGKPLCAAFCSSAVLKYSCAYCRSCCGSLLKKNVFFLAKGGSKKALEAAATADLEITEINKLTAEVIQTPLKVIKKVEKSKQVIEAIEEEAESPLLPVAKKAKHDSQVCPTPEVENTLSRTGKVRASIKKAPVSRSRKAPSARVKRMSKRSSKNNFITPATGRIVDSCVQGGTSIVTPRFDSRIFKTPGLRTPALNERVYTVSANGSPLAEGNDVFITVPVGGGESIRLTASDLTKKNLLHLNPEAQGIMKKLSVRLAQACSGAKTHR
uniref:Cell division cycle associated 8 n=1 Tax=Anser cygnoides TaxID=8845 RepID=A0A8B9DBG5_ANSCY